ncbi:MAG: Ig-like domain-containing protein [Pirellulaceae bacterium]
MLEDRRLLHHGPTGGFGVVGDSLSDEYAQETYSYARNWVELLATESHFDLGRHETQSGNPLQWGEPRREGYEYNWARSGANSDSLLKSGQHTGLAKQIQQRQVRHAVLAIGQNDFHPDPEGYADGDDVAYDNIYHGTWSSQEITSYVNTVANNIETAATTLLADGVDLVISNVADYGFTPTVRQYYTNATMRQRVASVISQLNQQIDSLAQQYHITLVDLAGFATDVFGTNTQVISSQQIGGVVITNDAGTEATHAFVHDGVHPHTVTQAIMANLCMEGMNRGYGLDLDQYSEQEMVEFAGLSYGGQDTWNFDYANYVDVYSLNDSPTWTLPGAQQVDKNQSLAISGISVIDVDAGNGTLQVSLSAQHGVLTVAQTTGLQFTTGDGAADAQLVFTGTLTNLNAALGGLVYQPTQNFHGGETIQLSVNDQGNTGAGGARTTAITLGVTVNNVNTPPIAEADRYIVPPGGTLQVTLPGILANDRDDDGQAIVPAIVAGPFKGNLNLATDGSFTYTRNANGSINGSPGEGISLEQQDVFTYRVSDGNATSQVVQVTLLDNERVPWHNATRPLDVNDDGVTTPLDALHIINTLNQLGSRSLPTERTLEAPYYDVNFDGIVSPADVLHIINFLNRTASSAEGEVTDPPSLPTQPVPPGADLPMVPVTPGIDDLYYRSSDTRYQQPPAAASERDEPTPATTDMDDFWNWLGSLD